MFQAATVEEIAEEAGYSHGAVYRNIAGKEELFLAIFEDYVTQRIDEVAQATEIEGSFAKRARAAAVDGRVHRGSRHLPAAARV
jgi:AcrR family transcriptional regulator